MSNKDIISKLMFHERDLVMKIFADVSKNRQDFYHSLLVCKNWNNFINEEIIQKVISRLKQNWESGTPRIQFFNVIGPNLWNLVAVTGDKFFYHSECIDGQPPKLFITKRDNINEVQHAIELNTIEGFGILANCKFAVVLRKDGMTVIHHESYPIESFQVVEPLAHSGALFEDRIVVSNRAGTQMLMYDIKMPEFQVQLTQSVNKYDSNFIQRPFASGNYLQQFCKDGTKSFWSLKPFKKVQSNDLSILNALNCADITKIAFIDTDFWINCNDNKVSVVAGGSVTGDPFHKEWKPTYQESDTNVFERNVLEEVKKVLGNVEVMKVKLLKKDCVLLRIKDEAGKYCWVFLDFWMCEEDKIMLSGPREEAVHNFRNMIIE